MPKQWKWDLDLKLKELNIPLMVALMATSIGAFGEMPKTPKVMSNFFEKNPNLRWGLVYILLWQGSAGENEIEALVGTGATYLIWKYLNSLEIAEVQETPTDDRQIQ